jgi:metallo-beta-lactamase family protein
LVLYPGVNAVATVRIMTGSGGSPRADQPTLTFLGATGTVTGSRFLVETAHSRVLIDCGLFQGLKKLRLRNWEPFPVDPAAIDAVVITHAHVDHVGYLPRLCNLGFGGPVFSTGGTADLAEIVLPDSGHLHEEAAAYANKKGFSKHHPALPLYTEADALRALGRFSRIGFNEATDVGDGVSVTLRPAGHILGSSTVQVDLAGTGRSVLFSGDLGRPNHPLLGPPARPTDADVVVMESTYGGRDHDDIDATAHLADVITRTARRGGTVVIPAFAVDRTETVLFRLRELIEAGLAPELPVYVDSPMALRALQVYREAIGSGAYDVRPELADHPDPFDTGQLHEIRDVEGSKALAGMAHPSIIISASGMAAGGRVLHHLTRLLPDPRNTVVLVGFQAAGTRGRLLADGADEVKMLGVSRPVRAEIANFRSFSVHAGHRELVAWLGSANPRPDTAYLVHGEPAGAEALRASIETELDVRTVVPHLFERLSLA